MAENQNEGIASSNAVCYCAYVAFPYTSVVIFVIPPKYYTYITAMPYFTHKQRSAQIKIN